MNGQEPLDATRLYLAIGRITRALRRTGSAAIGHGALSVLATLTTEGPQRIGALAHAEGVSAPSMTRLVVFLEDLGHVRRSPDPADGRASIVEATASGSDLVLAGRAVRLAALADRVAALEPNDRAALLAALPALEKLSQDGELSATRRAVQASEG